MKKLYAALLAAALTAMSALPVSAASFRDVPVGSALADEVQKAADYHLMGGYSASNFGYSDPITRGQFAAVLVRMMVKTMNWDGALPQQPSFSDVPSSHTWYSVVETALAHDVVDRSEKFRPDVPITRTEMSEMLVRAVGLKGAAALQEKLTALPFTDVQAGKGYVAVAYQIGMTSGTSETTFAPTATATRGQAAAMLVRIYEKLSRATEFVHGFYAISSRNQLGLSDGMEAVSAGWSRMTWDGTAALLSTTSAGGNEYAIPSGYQDVTGYLGAGGTTLNLSVYMDMSGGVRELLASEVGRTAAVEQIVNELTVSYNAVGKNPYSGVTIDFESLRTAQKSDLTTFLTTLSSKVHSLGKSLYVCVSPTLTTGSYYDGYDYSAIGELADRVILMAYDYNTSDMSSFVGTEYYKTAAQAPADQVYTSLLAAAVQMGTSNASKLLLGFSGKPMAWKIGTDGKLLSGTPVYPSNETLYQRLGQANTVRGWSDTYQQPYAIYTTEDGSRYFVWYDNNDSVHVKLGAAKLLGITGVSLWRLGTIPTETDWNWNSLLTS
ncbi:S-layer homology domain-containing protein [Oscillibacter sp.]|uniref:S-layer homology domain-containing protein n=1 Tax=Oscillibacter sp. TaxID=1945593 RepID=UPI0028AEB080|nr:S-layer homology domain-containing protein [Oscillibacter sp.]